jgi:MFS family permease
MIARTEQRAAGSYRGILQNPQFRRLWMAAVAARVGEAIAQIALPLLVYSLTGSASLMSVIFVVQMIPRTILAPIAGVIADRYDRRRIMIFSSVIRAIGVAFLPFTTSAWQVGVIAAFIAIGTALVWPAELAALPSTVQPNEIVTALSLTQVMGSVSRILGPAAGAALIGVAGLAPAFWLEAACFAVAVGFLIPLQLPPTEVQAAPDGGRQGIIATTWQEILVGVRTVWNTPVVRGISAVESLWSLLAASLTISMVVYTQEYLDLGNRAELVFGLLAATLSFGAVLGALVASRVERRIGRPRLMAIGYLGPLLTVPILIDPPLSVLFACWFVLGFADAWAVIAMQAYLAESVPNNLRGRVFAIWGGIVAASALVGYGLVGWITERFGAPVTVALAGVIVGIGGPLVLALTGALKAVREEVPVQSEPEVTVEPGQA